MSSGDQQPDIFLCMFLTQVICGETATVVYSVSQPLVGTVARAFATPIPKTRADIGTASEQHLQSQSMQPLKCIIYIQLVQAKTKIFAVQHEDRILTNSEILHAIEITDETLGQTLFWAVNVVDTSSDTRDALKT